TYFTTVVGINFWVSLIIAIALSAATGVFVERTALRPMVGKPIFAVAIMTIGLNTMLTVFALAGLGIDLRPIGEPWGLKTIEFAGFVIAQRQVAALVTAVVLTSALLVFFKYSRMGLAMRAAAFDQEVALTPGVAVAAASALHRPLPAARTSVVEGMGLAGAGRRGGRRVLLVRAAVGGVRHVRRAVRGCTGRHRPHRGRDGPERLARAHGPGHALRGRRPRGRPDHRHRRDAHLDLSVAVPP